MENFGLYDYVAFFRCRDILQGIIDFDKNEFSSLCDAPIRITHIYILFFVSKVYISTIGNIKTFEFDTLCCHDATQVDLQIAFFHQIDFIIFLR